MATRTKRKPVDPADIEARARVAEARARIAEARSVTAEKRAASAQATAVGRYYRQLDRAMQRRPSMSFHGGLPSRTSDGPYSGGFSFTGRRPLSGHTLQTMRNRVRKLVANNYLASSMLNMSASFVIGSGTRIEPTTQDAQFNQQALEIWTNWWTGAGGSSPDLRGLCDGPEIERQVYIARLRDGDAATLLLQDGRLQMIEADLIETPDGRSGDFSVADGVEVNAVGRPVGFWLRAFDQRNPHRRAWRRIGEENVVWTPRIKRTDQVRGQPGFAQSLELFEQLEGYIDAVVMAARMGAMFGLLIREQPGRWTDLPKGSTSEGVQRPVFDLEPAMVKRLGPADDVIQVKPEQPHTQFDQFVASLVRFAGLELGLPLELAFLDFSRTTYSSARASMIVAQRVARAEHRCFASRFISRIYRWRISKFINDNQLKAPADMDVWRHRAIMEPHAYLDPTKEIAGELMQVDGGMGTLGEALIRRGSSLDEFIRARSAELTALREAGIGVSRSTNTRDSADGLESALPVGSFTNNERGEDEDEEPDDA